jgi:hypothetical protein
MTNPETGEAWSGKKVAGFRTRIQQVGYSNGTRAVSGIHMSQSSRRGPVYSNSKRPRNANRLAALAVCAPLAYATYMWLRPHVYRHLAIPADRFFAFICVVAAPGVLLYVCTRIAGPRTAWACVTILAFFALLQFLVLHAGGGMVLPGVSLGELIVGGVLLPIAVSTGDRRTGF